eukprot:9469267-Pyramimonas_sp.AAC.1
MLVRLFGSVGLSQPWPNIIEVALIPNLPPELETYFRAVLPETAVGIDSMVYDDNATGLSVTVVPN